MNTVVSQNKPARAGIAGQAAPGYCPAVDCLA